MVESWARKVKMSKLLEGRRCWGHETVQPQELQLISLLPQWRLSLAQSYNKNAKRHNHGNWPQNLRDWMFGLHL